MPRRLDILRGLSLAGGLLLTCIAAAPLVVAGLATVHPQDAGGQSFFEVALVGTSFTLLLALPLLAWPFSSRAARWITGALLCASVALLIRYVFRSDANPAYQVMAVVMGLLAALRIWLAWQQPRPAGAPSPGSN